MAEKHLNMSFLFKQAGGLLRPITTRAFSKLALGLGSLLLACSVSFQPVLADSEPDGHLIDFGGSLYRVPDDRNIKLISQNERDSKSSPRRVSKMVFRVDHKTSKFSVKSKKQVPWGLFHVVLGSARNPDTAASVAANRKYAEFVADEIPGLLRSIDIHKEDIFLIEDANWFGNKFDIKCNPSSFPPAKLKGYQDCHIRGVVAQDAILVRATFRSGKFKDRDAWPMFPEAAIEGWQPLLRRVEDAVNEILVKVE